MPRGETTRSKIEKVNATIASLLKEMREDYDTEQFIDWGDLINRLKAYRSDLEDDLTKEENELSIEPLPEAIEETDTDSEPTRADTSPPPEWAEDWNSAKEKQFMDNPDVYERGAEELPGYETDEDDFLIEPDDDDLEREDDDDING